MIIRKNPEIDLSAEFVTTIWRDSDATNIGTNDATNGATNSGANDLTINTNSTTNVGTNIGTNIGTSGNSVATDLLVDEYFFIIPCLF